MPKVERVTLFKIPKAEDRAKLMAEYKVLCETAVKDGKPYILQLAGGEAADEARAQGWNMVSKTTFASKEDMDYYDNGCEAHQKLKAYVAKVREDVMTVWFEGGVDARL